MQVGFQNILNMNEFPHCVYLSLPAEIMAVGEHCYELYWCGTWVAEFSCQEAAERYLKSEFCHTL